MSRQTALAWGGAVMSDVPGRKNDPLVGEVGARRRVPVVLMHMRGDPATMQRGPFARDVMKDVLEGLRASITKARKADVAKSQIIVDPGIGFGKSLEQNFELLRKLPQLAKL